MRDVIKFQPDQIQLTKYLFYTGKGGVGKTSTACATAVRLADIGKKVLLISTDPASNLQDVFGVGLSNEETQLEQIPNLTIINLDPIVAAEEYKESVIAPYRGIMPESVLQNMEEQLSGSCTVEIASFNEFSKSITDKQNQLTYDHVIFDTAPTGHTLRLLQLPSAWTNFISESTHGASCLGQLSGLEASKDMYAQAVNTLTNKDLTTLILVTRPETSAIREADRASRELRDIGIQNQICIINGLLFSFDDSMSESLYNKQQHAIQGIPDNLRLYPMYSIALRTYNAMGIENIRAFLMNDTTLQESELLRSPAFQSLGNVIDDLHQSNKRVIFTMGKGGVGKTTVAAAIALGLSNKGKKVHLTTTDPAAHLDYVIKEAENITISHIDETAELEKYRNEVLSNAKSVMSGDDLAYIEEDLRSPCTQEIAVFRAFANIVEKADEEVVVIDTAPTGHTLLLLDSTQRYSQDIERTNGEVPRSVSNLLPRLRNENETEVVIVTLAESTPVMESLRLEEDLKRASIPTKWWIVNQSMLQVETTNQFLNARASHEIPWINTIDEHTNGNFAVVGWQKEEVAGKNLQSILK